MNPFRLEVYKILDSIKSLIITYINRYFSGNTSTGEKSEIEAYIGTTAGQTTNTIKTDMMGLTTSLDVDGTLSVIQGTSPTTITVQPNTMVYTIELIGTTKPTMTVDTIATPLEYTPLRLTNTGTVSLWKGVCHYNGMSSTTVVIAPTNATSAGLTFLQDQSSIIAGVIIT